MTDVKVSELSFIAQELTAPEVLINELIEISGQLDAIEEKLKNLQYWKKFLTAQKEEAKESLRPYIGQTINGFKVSEKITESLGMDKDAVIPEEFKRIKPAEPEKEKIKAAIRSGKVFEGFWIETNSHVQITASV